MSRRPAADTAEVTLDEIEALLGRWCDHVQPALVGGGEAAALVEQLGRMRRRLDPTQARLAGRVDECRAWSHRCATASGWLSQVNGTSSSEAQRTLETVKQLADLPVAAAAFEAGELSTGEAQLVAAAAAVNPDAEGRLVEEARRHDFARTREVAHRARHAVFSREQAVERATRQRRLRRLVERVDDDGLAQLDTHLVPDDWAGVTHVLQAYVDREFQAARGEGRCEDHASYRADALIECLRVAGAALGLPTPSPRDASPPVTDEAAPVEASLFDDELPTEPASATGEPRRCASHSDAIGLAGAVEVRDEPTSVVGPTVRTAANPVVLVDGIALRRGFAAEGETCELASSGSPVTVEWIASMMPDSALDVLVHDRVDVRAYARVRRRRPRSSPSTGSPPGGDLRPTVVVLIDAIALHRPTAGLGVPIPGTELVIDRTRLRDLVPPEIAGAVESGLVDITSYRSGTRHKPRPVVLTLLARDRFCAVPGCRACRRLEHDHNHDFAKLGPTDTENLHALCDRHHADKTHRGARLEITATDRLWYPPRSDQREGDTVPWCAALGEHLSHWDLEPGLGGLGSDTPDPA